MPAKERTDILDWIPKGNSLTLLDAVLYLKKPGLSYRSKNIYVYEVAYKLFYAAPTILRDLDKYFKFRQKSREITEL